MVHYLGADFHCTAGKPLKRQSQNLYAFQAIIVTLLLCLTPFTMARADVVKPALIEISANVNGTVTLEIRASVEALLTGINGRFKNTKEAPNAEAYDALRVLESGQLREKLRAFEPQLLDAIWLHADQKPVSLTLQDAAIPAPGYVKVPRISVLSITGELPRSASSLQLYYPAKFGDSAVRVRQVDEANEKWHWSEWQWIRDDEVTQPYSLTEVFTRRPAMQVIAEYISIGFAHIIPLGLDHILFILGLFLFSNRLKPLLWQVTMFTLAHTLTLGLSMAEIISLPARVVEPLIALSIAWIAVENIFNRGLKRGRLAVVFGFGLLHGLGFASVLSDFGMPNDAFVTALIGFNVGVELGQVAILLAGYLLLSKWFGERDWYRNLVVIPGSLAIAATGLWWTFERLLLV